MTALTKEAIKNSFIKLLEVKPIGKITVREIVEDCGINRNSFYYHFDDIPSLLEEILNERADKLIQLNADASIYDCLMTTIDIALKNKSAMMHIYNSANKDMFEHYLNRVSLRTVSEFIEAKSRGYDISESDKAVITMYYKSLLVGFVVDWMGSGMKYEISDSLKRTCELFEGSTETAFLRASGEKK